MKRIFDFIGALIAIVVLFCPLLGLALIIWASDSGPVLYWSDRVGRNNRIFKMPKFRSMRVGTPEVATDKLQSPDEWLTSIGSLIRRSSIDELPQLWSILRGEMSFVGPRPALFNQSDLIALRDRFGVYQLRPGLTGLAQVNGRDDQSITQKVSFDVEYLRNRSFLLDLKILWLTVVRVTTKNGVSH